ncbi:MAG: type III restriction endonuclease subunit R [Alphaproteobacteria bacterium]|nr:MAG: type III restriction endonuclease subunit R [Alphaproteobacteria bacterium]
MLRTLELKGVYKSDQDDILRSFYFPALAVADRYDRAVGYFSASTLSEAAQALTVFIKGDGVIRMIVGAFTAQGDIDAVREGLRLKEVSERIGAELVASVTGVDDELFQHRFKALAWLIAHDRLEIRVALRPNGIYHDKVGIITDAQGDAVVFSGSANESAAALLPTHNYESINVFPTWRPELAPWHEPHRDSFARLWDNKSRGTVVIDLPTALKENLLEVAATLDAPPDSEREAQIAARLRTLEAIDETEPTSRLPRAPDTINGMPFKMREHQLEALRAWQANGYRGIFDLATGAGKTITAVYATLQMAKGVPGLVVVIAAPYQSLADQWCEILEAFNIRPLQCYVSKENWHEDLQKRVLDMQGGSDAFQAIVVVNRTLQTPEFQAALARIPSNRLLWIGDECHHHGSESLVSGLPSNAAYRIGLSATPMHYLDEQRNDRLKAYYGDVVFSYSLAQAITDKVLTPYNYYPAVVPLTPDEASEFISLSDDIARAFMREGKSAGPPSIMLTALLMKRARIIGSAANKMAALQNPLSGQPPQQHALFYCGDGQVEMDGIETNDQSEDSQPTRQIEAVSRLLDGQGWKVSRFTARESRRERESILQSFRTGAIDGLVAIKCLDEGIDVPACSIAYILASSRDPRQFIQRRGRILRRSPGKTIANIHDYIVVLPEDAHDESGAARKLFTAELKRVAEFSSLAENRNEAYAVLRPILTAYDLEHVL